MVINSRVFQRVCHWGSVSWCLEVYLDGRMVGFAWNLKDRNQAELQEKQAIEHLKNGFDWQPIIWSVEQ